MTLESNSDPKRQQTDAAMAELASLSNVDKARCPELAGWLWGLLCDHPVLLSHQSAHDGIMNRNREFDKDRWWYPLYRLVLPPAS
jgi:hypothetical protein